MTEKCEYCQENVLTRADIKTVEGQDLTVRVVPVQKMLYITYGCGCNAYVEARHCPMCGREL